MIVNCVSFLDPMCYHGGGEMISRKLIEVGQTRGHKISITSVRPRSNRLLERSDLTLFIDVFNYAHTFRSLGAWRTFHPAMLERVAKQRRFVHLTTAYADVCNLGHLPCCGRSHSKCPFKPLPALQRALLRDEGSECFTSRSIVKMLYESASLNVFLSPLHLATSERLLGQMMPNGFVLRPVIDTTQFRNYHQQRDIEYLFVGLIGEAKGLSEMRERFRDTDIHLIGQAAPGAKIDFGRHIGFVPYAEVPRWMNRAANFVFLPHWPEPQGRVVAEAALCGCTIIGNGNVGALSFDFDLADPFQYGASEQAFWEVVETL